MGTKSKKKKKKHKTIVESSELAKDPNSIYISDAETESGNDKNDASDKEEIEEDPEKHTKNTKYTKEDFIATKHSSEREPWVQKPMPFPDKKHKSKVEELTPDAIEKKQNTGKVETTINTWHMCKCNQV